MGLLPTTARLGGRATTASAYFLGLPLGLVDLGCWSGTIEGKGTAAKGMSVVCCLGGRPGRRLRPLETDLGLGGRPGLFSVLDLKVPGGRPRPLLTEAGGCCCCCCCTGATSVVVAVVVVGGGGTAVAAVVVWRERKTFCCWGLGLGGRPRPLWVKGVKGRCDSPDPVRVGGGGSEEGSLYDFLTMMRRPADFKWLRCCVNKVACCGGRTCL